MAEGSPVPQVALMSLNVTTTGGSEGQQPSGGEEGGAKESQ